MSGWGFQKLASDVQRKVSHDDLEKFLDRAVERAIQVYTTMQRNQAADEMVTGTKNDTADTNLVCLVGDPLERIFLRHTL